MGMESVICGACLTTSCSLLSIPFGVHAHQLDLATPISVIISLLQSSPRGASALPDYHPSPVVSESYSTALSLVKSGNAFPGENLLSRIGLLFVELELDDSRSCTTG